MGILGFIDRFKNSTTSNTSTSNLETSFDDVNAKLNKVWTQEFSHLFVHIPQQDTNTVPEVEDKNIYEGKTANMNKLAKGVKLNGLLKI